ncbi:hypothetical protein HSX44_00605 [Wolbachia endosymbiont of Onchocerca gibsoni]|uniref:hypothetical protein n=1 Tax=Wolbachia endosymbiont of Onchocerca gibsoni TaxID=118986 RepID=UPI0023D7D80F|nr:hypothetical protein [Wolbachia endosymbiont of Onchocerca gibsoni]MDF0607412.1 hypothetical protein [Wolbachia endosymbiont of Onchocerca gibsoni]
MNNKPYIKFFTIKRINGEVVNTTAIKQLKVTSLNKELKTSVAHLQKCFTSIPFNPCISSCTFNVIHTEIIVRNCQ